MGRARTTAGGVPPAGLREGPIGADPRDSDALARVRAGDAGAYADLVRRHTPVALRTAAVLGAGPDAEDVVQEAFVKAYRALPGFRPGEAFRPWLLRIVANETRNLHRSAGRRAARERTAWQRAEPLLAGGADPASAALGGERRTELVRALGTLSARHREVVAARYLLDLDEAEAAAVLGVPRGTVKSRLHRALGELAAVLATGPRAGAPAAPREEGTR